MWRSFQVKKGRNGDLRSSTGSPGMGDGVREGRGTVSEGVAGAGERLRWRSGIEVEVGIQIAGGASAHPQVPKGPEKNTGSERDSLKP